LTPKKSCGADEAQEKEVSNETDLRRDDRSGVVGRDARYCDG
jgi:hypothetical protein